MTEPRDFRHAARRQSWPPSGPAPAFRLGVTGHRSEMLGASAPAVTARIERVVSDVKAAVHDSAAVHPGRFGGAQPSLAMVSALADGADQIAARAAIALGYRLCAIMPFSSGTTRDVLPASARPEFDRLARSAAWLVELPGDPADPLEAYINVGRATLDHSDLLMAVWDGLPPRGRGGTGEVVQMAIADGTPVLHIPVNPSEPPAILQGRARLPNAKPDRGLLDCQSLSELIGQLLSPGNKN